MEHRSKSRAELDVAYEKMRKAAVKEAKDTLDRGTTPERAKRIRAALAYYGEDK